MHKQENIYNRQLFSEIVDTAINVSSRISYVLVLQEPTRNELVSIGLE